MDKVQEISISLDQVWVGSGQLRNGIIENCGAQFCNDNDLSLEVYELIECAIVAHMSSIKVELDGEVKTIAWSLTSNVP